MRESNKQTQTNMDSRKNLNIHNTMTTTTTTTTTTPGFVGISHLVLVRLLIALTIMTIFMNLLFLLPLEDSEAQSKQQYILNPNGHSSKTTSQHHHQQQQSSILITENNVKNKQSSSINSKSNSNPNQISFPKLSEEEGRQHILDMFKEAKVILTPEMESKLPSWSQVQEVIGPHPYILGLEHCTKFQQIAPPLERMLGSAGMFNTGTNLVTHLLKQNCEIPERRQKYGPKQSKESYGMRWQVPWGKHTPAKFRSEHSTKKATNINKDYILPIVTIRNPYTWFRSMCTNGYTASWDRGRKFPDNCPKLKLPNGEWNPVTVKYAEERTDNHMSLAHLWNDWYGYYVRQSEFPFVLIRMEDLVFYPKETIKIVCECAGGEIRTDQSFQYITDSAKADSPGHDTSTGLSAAWIKYSQRPPPRYGYNIEDYEAAKEALNSTLMEAMGYQHPLNE